MSSVVEEKENKFVERKRRSYKTLHPKMAPPEYTDEDADDEASDQDYDSYDDTDENENEENENVHPKHVPANLMDYYLKEIGQSIYTKLHVGRESGAVHPIKMSIPWPVWSKIVDQMQEHGAEVKRPFFNDEEDGDEIKCQQCVCYIRKQQSAQKIFSRTNIAGKNSSFLTRITPEKRRRYSYSSTQMAVVVISNLTPITLTYLMMEQELHLSFFVQRYDGKGTAQSTCLQALADISLGKN